MKHRGLFILGAAAVLALAATDPAWAMRCGSVIVDTGATTDQVLQSCGAPLKKDVTEVRKGGTFRKDKIKTGVSRIETWTYDLGDGMLHILTFVDGKLTDEKTQPKWLEQGK